jgi:BED zinc finger
MPDPDTEYRYFSTTGKEEWRCKYCPKTYSVNGGTRVIQKHLLEKHKKTEKSPREETSAKRQRSIEHAFELSQNQSFKRRKLNTSHSDGNSLDSGHLEVLYVKFLTACHLPLRLVECPEFRDLLNYINDDIDTWLPSSHNTITHWVLRQFDYMKEQMKSRLDSALTDIHISCDLWTSPNCLPIFGIVGHYISSDGQLESPTLALVDIDGEHSGENLAKYLQEVVEDWGIGSKLGYLQMDNAGNNDTMIREFEDRKYINPVFYYYYYFTNLV